MSVSVIWTLGVEGREGWGWKSTLEVYDNTFEKGLYLPAK